MIGFWQKLSYCGWAATTVALMMSIAPMTLHGAELGLAWDLPTQYADGTPLENLAGCRVYYGTTSSNYSHMVELSGDTSECTLTGLDDETTYFIAVTAYDAMDVESAFSAEIIWTSAPADADGDGLPDSWELAYASGSGDLDPEEDDDGDGASNREEFLAGTTPNDPSSVFAVTGVVREPDGQIAVHWKSAEGRNYEVQSTTSLGTPFVTVASVIAATAPENVWRHTPAANSTCFYRVRLAD